MDMNEHLAGVMGWELHSPDSLDKAQWFYSIDRKFHLWQQEWNPTEDISQAMMLLDKFDQWGVSKGLVDENYLVGIYHWVENSDEDMGWEAEHESLPMAICLAVCRATGYEE